MVLDFYAIKLEHVIPIYSDKLYLIKTLISKNRSLRWLPWSPPYGLVYNSRDL